MSVRGLMELRRNSSLRTLWSGYLLYAVLIVDVTVTAAALTPALDATTKLIFIVGMTALYMVSIEGAIMTVFRNRSQHGVPTARARMTLIFAAPVMALYLLCVMTLPK